MPIAIVKRDELRATKTGDWLGAVAAFPCKQLSEALGAERFVVFRGKLLPGEKLIAVGAGEAVTVKRCVLVGDAAFVDHSVALEAALGVLLFVARNADDLLVTWYETLDSDWLETGLAAEALLVPLFASVLVFLHS